MVAGSEHAAPTAKRRHVSGAGGPSPFSTSGATASHGHRLAPPFSPVGAPDRRDMPGMTQAVERKWIKELKIWYLGQEERRTIYAGPAPKGRASSAASPTESQSSPANSPPPNQSSESPTHGMTLFNKRHVSSPDTHLDDETVKLLTAFLKHKLCAMQCAVRMPRACPL